MKVLIVRFSSIGDVILTTPIIRALKQQRPDVELHFITKESFKCLVEYNPHVKRVYTFKQSVKEILPELRSEKYDRIVDLHHNLRSVLLSLYLGVKAYRFRKLNFRKWILVRLKWNYMAETHVVDRYFGAVSQLGVANDKKAGELYLSEKDKVSVQQTLGVEPGRYLSVAIGAQFATKQMPLELLERVLRKVAFPIVLCGGEGDNAMAEAISEALPQLRILNACGKFSLLQSASVVSQSAAILTNDTGLMHIASCFHVPIVSVWGNTVPELGMYPYAPEKISAYSIHQVNDVNCRPCSKIGFRKCPKGHFDCMRKQDPEEIVRQISTLIR
jgi:ADP-heptose:LPS heptosyltransferase